MASSALERLVDCAKAIRDGNLKLADSILQRIWKLAADESDEQQSKVVKYFAEALVRRAYGLHPAVTYCTPQPSLFPSNNFSSRCFCNDIVEDAIIYAAMGKKQLHLIDFRIPNAYRYKYLFTAERESVRVSVILPTTLEKSVYVQKEMWDFNELAKLYKLELEDLKIVYANNLGEVDESILDFRRTEDEAVVVCYSFKFHELLAETAAMERELSKLRQINPETVIIVEQDADHNNSDFIKRLEDSFQYYSDAFRFSSSCGMKNHYKRQIHNIVGCEGRERIIRHQTLAQWRFRLQSGGFSPFSLGLLNYCKDFHDDNGCAVFTFNNRPMFYISAWKLTDKKNDFNPINDNFVSGLSPNLVSENVVQPFRHFPKGFLLNQLAALAEIYDILEEVCFTYDLPLALTWACGANVNEFMSDPNKKRSLFIQSAFCYAEGNSCFCDFIAKCEKQPLPEGQATAGKALQKSEHFHFETCIANLNKSDYPLDGYSCKHMCQKNYDAAVAICLQNRYTAADVYVVEFFLPTFETQLEKPKSLAFRIFNDLKNMKKVFVTVEVQGTEFQFQEKAISNIPQVTIPTRNPPPTSSASYLLHSNTSDGHEMEIQELNEQGSEKYADINNLPTSSAKRRKLRSNVWEEFTKKEDGDRKICAICTHCNRKFDGSSTKGTTHLRNHLERCKIRAANVRDRQLIFSIGRDDSKNESASEGNSSFDQDKSRMNFARMVIKKQWPLNIVEDEFFNSFLKELQPLFKLQSQEALISDIVRVYKDEKHELIEYFGKLSCRFNLIISTWTHDLERTTYYCYAVQFIDDNWKLRKKILALKSLGNQFDKRIFYENFKNFLVDWNFDKKVCSLTLQNSSPFSDIAEEIRTSWHCFEASHPLSTFYISSDECISGLLYEDNSGENVGKIY